MLIVASANADVGMKAAMAVLRDGGPALDAVEVAIRAVEANPHDHTVGANGYPNLLGELELDASIVDGRTREAGAVAAMKGFAHPISVARKVMETLPHVLLVGAGAERFAREMGFEAREDLLDDDTRAAWETRLTRDMPREVFERVAEQPDLWRWVKLASDAERALSTVNVIARDARGDIASGVSTSGWAWKYPGRVGDSPIVGAGNYADNRHGAAGCTGMGEMALRAATAHRVVIGLEMGLNVEQAGRRAMEDLRSLGGPYLSRMNLVAIDRRGNHAGFTSAPRKTYLYQTAEMNDPAEAERVVVPLEHRWPSQPKEAP